MKNADKPINPIVQEENVGQGQRILMCSENGLNKREYFAGLAMQGLLAANATYNGKTDDRITLSKDAIAFADELLKQLETPTKDNN